MKFLKDKILDLKNLIYVYLEQFKRSLFWAKNMRYSYDFDAHSIYKMLYLKIDRIYTEMINNNHCTWNSSPDKRRMRQLLECRELLKRLYEDEYRFKPFRETELKYGMSRSQEWTTVGSNKLLHTKLRWKNNPEEAEKFYKRRCMFYTNLYKQHKDRCFYLLKNNIPIWWD